MRKVTKYYQCPACHAPVRTEGLCDKCASEQMREEMRIEALRDRDTDRTGYYDWGFNVLLRDEA
jgi:hypothetical protein